MSTVRWFFVWIHEHQIVFFFLLTFLYLRNIILFLSDILFTQQHLFSCIITIGKFFCGVLSLVSSSLLGLSDSKKSNFYLMLMLLLVTDEELEITHHREKCYFSSMIVSISLSQSFKFSEYGCSCFVYFDSSQSNCHSMRTVIYVLQAVAFAKEKATIILKSMVWAKKVCRSKVFFWAGKWHKKCCFYRVQNTFF